MIIVPPEIYIPPGHLRGLEHFMSDKPGDWHVLLGNQQEGRYTLTLEDEHARYFLTCQVDTAPLFDLNNSDENDSSGKRFGDGRVVARIPDHLLYANEGGEIGKAMDEGDRKYVRKKLNDGDFRKFRSFRGTL